MPSLVGRYSDQKETPPHAAPLRKDCGFMEVYGTWRVRFRRCQSRIDRKRHQLVIVFRLVVFKLWFRR